MTNPNNVRKHTDELREAIHKYCAAARTQYLEGDFVLPEVIEQRLYKAVESLFQKEREAQVERAEKAVRVDERNQIGAFLNNLVDQDVDHELDASDVVYQYGEHYQKEKSNEK